MTEILGAEYLTVDETARALKVSTATVWRWINRGQLAAYRVGQRRVRIKGADVAGLITPARQSEETPGAFVQADLERERVRLARPLNVQEKERALAALAAVERIERERPLDEEQDQIDSVDLLRESREERSRQLA